MRTVRRKQHSVVRCPDWMCAWSGARYCGTGVAAIASGVASFEVLAVCNMLGGVMSGLGIGETP